MLLMGASSGGHYALITGFSAPRGSVAGIISLSGIDEVFTDERLFPGRYRTLLGYAPGTEDLNTLDPAGFYQEGAAPVLCTHFVRDTVVPLDSCLTFAQKLRELGAHPSLYLYDFGRDNQGHALWIPETKPRRLYADLAQTVLFFLKNTLSQDDAQRGKHEN
jgi:acetyl esterase/lipase